MVLAKGLAAASAVALLALSATASADETVSERVADIAPGSVSSAPRELVDLGGTVLFAANDGVHGEELWRSDGTAAGTVMVEDIDPSPGASSRPTFLTRVGNQVFFVADDGTSGLELWRSDGTAAGTHLVEDITTPPETNKAPSRFTDFNGTLLFTVDGGEGKELWRSDGTEAGTSLVKDINTTTSTAGGNVGQIVVAGDYALFNANDGEDGAELWRTDGTTAGTLMVKDIVTGAAGSSAQPISTVAGITYLFVITPDAGQELWRTDGTAGGTVLVKDIRLGPLGSFPSPPVPVANGLVFGADDGVHGTELWRTDGTEAGTQLLADIEPGPGSSQPSLAASAATNGRVIFAASDGVHGVEPWVTDGSAAGTTLLADLAPGPPEGVETIIGFAAQAVGNRVFFAGGGPATGNELWSTDGTPSGTAQVRDIEPNPGVGSFPGAMIESAGRLFFSAEDSVAGQELWRAQHIVDPEAGGSDNPAVAPLGSVDSVPPTIFGKRWKLNRKGVVTLRLKCPQAQALGPCAGTVTLSTRRKVKFNKRKRKVVLAKGRYAIPAGETKNVKLKLSKPKRKLLSASKPARKVGVTVRPTGAKMGNTKYGTIVLKRG